MDQQYVIGIDIGSQSAKVAIYNEKGNVCGEGKIRLQPMHTPKPGIVEHPGDDLWDSLAKASKLAMEHFTGPRSAIKGVGLCSIRFCRALLKADGTLAQPVISWMDERLSRPYTHENCNVAWVTTTSGYLTQRLTGQFVDTVGDYQGFWPVDSDRWDWSKEEEVLQQQQIPREMLFELTLPGSVLGTITSEAAALTGIPAGLPVVATSNDKAVEALGAGASSSETAVVSLGTYISAMVHGKENRKDSEHFWTNFGAMPFSYLYESHGIRRGMWTISWLKQLLGEDLAIKAAQDGISPEAYLNQRGAEVPVGSEGLVAILDWLAPSNAPYRKGMFIGFDQRHGQAHMYRAIVEAIAMTMKNHLDAMNKERDEQIRELILSGGGADSNLMMQVFADVFGLPVKRNEVTGSASLGAAINAAVGLGIYNSYDEAISRMIYTKDCFQPSMANHKLYTDINANFYKDLQLYTDQILRKRAAVFGE